MLWPIICEFAEEIESSQDLQNSSMHFLLLLKFYQHLLAFLMAPIRGHIINSSRQKYHINGNSTRRCLFRHGATCCPIAEKT